MTAYMIRLLIWTVFIAVLIFWPAGTLAYPGGWVFMIFMGLGGFIMIWWLAKVSPSLLRERMAAPWQRGQASWDRVWLSLFVVLFCGWLALMSWDAARTGFTAVPLWLQVVGVLAIIANYLGTWATFRENAFAAPVVKLQENQKVIDTGPYAIVRHPMYTSALCLFLGTPLAMGSWLGLAVGVVFCLALAWRAVHEENALREGLPGYDAYMSRVCYRFIPFVW
ncbi:methyltransferase family protein [Brucella sp. IR073]|uniref:methyltransferase family protein n=1 Tax=unclassified Brucella TaxID=2632610 RepID=UPI003B97D03A